MADTLLVIEDDMAFSNALRLILTKSGFQVHVAHNALVGLQKAFTVNPDAVILDIMLPDLDGWQICSRLKETSNIPIIMLTAFGSEENVVKGLNLGADGYIIKPVTAQELVARITAILRRVPRLNGKDSNDRKRIFTYDNLVVDYERHQVTVGGKSIYLSPTEFRLLSVLIQYQGHTLPHDFLLREVWGSEYMSEMDCLRLYISYLRRKIETDPNKPSLIYNEWGIGYRFG
ncbi:MAG: DNA-binding response regulator [Chloroflexota bacterium]|nr:MAG: DNA-binding response regulator [Chloroflexota bacterium]